MGFDTNKFRQTEFIPREEKVKVLGLKEFFDDDEEPTFTIRGLTGYEVGFCNEARDRNKNVNKLLTGLVSSSTTEVIETVKKAIGVGLSVTDDVARRIEMLKLASVDPVLDHELVKKLCEDHAVIFWDLTNKVLELTGLGAIPGKANASGVMLQSEQP